MAIWTGRKNAPYLLKQVEEWKKSCLLSDRSVFTNDTLWSAGNIKELKTLFVDHPIEGNQTFYKKLQLQLEEADPKISHLASEALWLLLLFVGYSSFGIALKKERFAFVWSFSKSELPLSTALGDEVLKGLASPGTAFLTMMWAEYAYLLQIMVAWKELSKHEQQGLLEDNPWGLCAWVTEVEGGDVRAFRHMFLYLCYPTEFERICSKNHKKTIYEVFNSHLEHTTDPYKQDVSPCNLDKSIFLIRQSLVVSYGTEELDFYHEPLKSQWLKGKPRKKVPPTSPIEIPKVSAPNYWVEKTIVKGREHREHGPHRLGECLWSPQRSKSGTDIYSNMRKVIAGDIILHLTDNSAITGVSIATDSVDEDFIGVPGTEWGETPSYRISLRDFVKLDPQLPRDAFLNNGRLGQAMRSLLETRDGQGLFYNKNLDLNQGSYLTGASTELVNLLNQAYLNLSEKRLPYTPEENTNPSKPEPDPKPVPYTLENALDELFFDKDTAEQILVVWKRKKNIILQGPPGVGKSFAARRMAYALIGEIARDRVDYIQFHQSYSYEEFVQGYRPSSNGFVLKNGRFYEFCKQAEQHIDQKFVFIIDEINRGNLSKIFGELMVLIEPDKRGSEYEMPLAYGSSGDMFNVPENVFIMGLMNTADRSLAVVDYALRRRFGFLDLKPQIASEKFKAHLEGLEISIGMIEQIETRIGELNKEIKDDTSNLGEGFCIGHSFFTSEQNIRTNEDDWYRLIINTEILPLLKEYWFDNQPRLDKWRKRLLNGV